MTPEQDNLYNQRINYPDNPTGWMRQLMDEFLAQPDDEWRTEDLGRFLSGEGLPPLLREEEPYAWILDDLGSQDDNVSRDKETKFAARLGRFIDEEPENWESRSRERMLHNLFSLCSELSRSDHLGEPLWRLYNRWEKRGLEPKLGKRDLRHGLRSALIANQLEDRLLPVWQRMLQREKPWDEPGGYLPGDYRHGFHGVLTNPDIRNKPDLHSLGLALGKVAWWLKDNKRQRVEKFKPYLDQAGSVLLGISAGKVRVQLAKHHKWPGWTAAVVFMRGGRPRAFFRWGNEVVVIASVGKALHDLFGCKTPQPTWEEQIPLDRIDTASLDEVLAVVDVNPEALNFLDDFANRLRDDYAGEPYSSTSCWANMYGSILGEVLLSKVSPDDDEYRENQRNFYRRDFPALAG